MANPNMIGGGRMTRAEVSGDRRRPTMSSLNKGQHLLRLWKYLGRNRFLLVMALILSVSSSLLALYGPGDCVLLKASHFFGRFDLMADFLRDYPFEG